ncbi:Putative beta-glucuronidase [Paraconexibacter sp. AEG42_29]|uniref:Beta-glucuronidase n=1 Tax=Paraconexibacter sp. AEG42_29 TaxID=2997339 RepID=A0AAU7B396_9ACTN
MHRRSLATSLAAFLAVLCLLQPASSAAEDVGVPAPFPLTAGWQKFEDRGNVGVGLGLYTPDNKAAWKPAVVPSVFSGQTPESSFRGTVGWYRATFKAPEKTPGFTYDIHFEQVRRVAQVWLNGVRLGRHEDPYVPFDLQVGNALKPGQRNVLVVRVDNRKDGAIREGWWNWGGITRPVTLVPRAALVLQTPGVLSVVDCPPGGATDGAPCTAKVRFDGVLVNRGDSTIENPQVRLDLGAGGAVTQTIPSRPLAPGESTHLASEVAVPDPQLWSPEKPTLYDVTLTTSAGDRMQQVDTWKTGLREVKVRNGMLTLNGRQLTLRGASIQEDVPGRGPALKDEDIAGIVRDLKAVRANVTRAHYLLHPKLLDALDAAGIMVWSQAPVYHRDVRLKHPEQRETALASVRGTILSARNHPSVITHSVANELSPTPDTVPGTRAFLAAARTLASELDPTLPPSVDMLSYPGYARQAAYAQYPLLGINSYFGWYQGKKDHSVANLADFGPFLDRLRRQYPTQGLQVTEFGAESTYSGPVTEKETYAFQTQYLKDVLAIIDARPFIGGAIYWTLREFAVKPNWVGGHERPGVKRDSIHRKGLITYAGRKKPAWQVAADDFGQTPLYRTVSPAAAAGVPEAKGGGGSVLAIIIAVGVIGLLAVDGWAIAGIWRRDGRLRRTEQRRRAGKGKGKGGDGIEPAGARAL